MAPDRLFHAEYNLASSAAVAYAARLSRVHANPLAAGDGVGLELELGTATGGTNQVAATIAAVWVDPANLTRTTLTLLSGWDTAQRNGVAVYADGTRSLTGIGAGFTTAALPTSVLQSGGSFAAPFATTAIGVTLDVTHFHMDATAAVTVTLPAANGCAGRIYSVAHNIAAGGNVTISPTGADTVSGAASLVLLARYDAVLLQSDGVSDWRIL
jgi:hypothetical protein